MANLSIHGTDDSDALWMRRNNIEVLHNNKGDGTYSAILHQVSSQTGRTTTHTPWDVVDNARTARDAIQKLCDRNNMLSPWDIRELKIQLSLRKAKTIDA